MIKIADTTHIFNIIFQVIDKATKSLTSIDRNLKMISKSVVNASKLAKVTEISEIMRGIDIEINKSSKTFGGFNKQLLGIGLGMTFFMWGVQMQLKRMMRQMFTVWESAQLQTSGLLDKFNMMRASLGAISIAFFDAFAQSGLFDFIINAVTTLTNWFLDLDESTRQWIASGLFKGLMIAIGISVAGQILLGLNTLLQFFGEIQAGWAKIGALSAITLTIALAIDAIDAFVEGKIIKGLIASAAALATGYAAAGFISGKTGVGGAFLTLGIALMLIEKGVFFSAILGIAGFAVGILVGAFEGAWKLIFIAFQRIVWNPLISFIQTIATRLGAPKIASLFEDMKIQGTLFEKGVFDTFIGDITKYAGAFYKEGKSYDKTLNDFFNRLEGVGEPKTSNYPNQYGTGVHKPMEVEIVNWRQSPQFYGSAPVG